MADKARLNWSTLKYIATSARLLKWRVEHAQAETEALRRGRSIHCAILEPTEFPKRWVTATKCCAVTKGNGTCKNQGKLYFEQQWYCGVSGHAPAGSTPTPGEGIEVMSEEDMKITTLCAESAFSHGPAADLLQGGKAEQKMEWKDPESGIECRGTIDCLRTDALIDLKSTRRETVREFAMDAARNLYHGQLAWYHDGAITAGRLPKIAAPPFVVAVSTCEPYDVAAFQLSQITLEAGRILIRDLVAKYQQCLAADLWPGIAPDLAVLDLPSWAPGMQGSEETERW
jgi:exodeoxyribonuclease VIII